MLNQVKIHTIAFQQILIFLYVCLDMEQVINSRILWIEFEQCKHMDVICNHLCGNNVCWSSLNALFITFSKYICTLFNEKEKDMQLKALKTVIWNEYYFNVLNGISSVSKCNIQFCNSTIIFNSINFQW